MSINKNILFISYDGMTDPLGQSQVIPYLIGLTRHGFKFTILSCDKPGRYRKYRDSILQLLEPYPIKWVAIPYHKKPPVFSSIYDVMMLRHRAKRLHEKEKFDMVHTRAGVPALIGLWMKKKFGVKFLHDIREFYADSRIEGGMWNNNNFFYKRIYNFFKNKEEEEVEKSDGIVCLTYAAEKIIKQWPQFKIQTPLEVIPCSVDLNLFDPGKIKGEIKNEVKKKLDIKENDFIISYLGSIGGWYLTDEMMKLCKKIFEKNTNAKFLFITPHQYEIIFETADKFGIPREKIIVTHAQRNEVPLFLSLSKFSVFFIKPCYSKKSSSPTKHGEIMAMGIPVITNSGVGDVSEIVNKYHSGIVLDDLSEEQFQLVAESISLQSPVSNLSNPVEIRNGAKQYYDLGSAVEKYRRIYNAILL